MDPTPLPTVVFVHGIFSSGKAWDPMVTMLREDPELAGVAMKTFTYSSPLARFNPARSVPNFDTIAAALRLFLDTHIGPLQSVVLVSHSQGGLVLQRLLAQAIHDGEADRLANIKHVILLACPSLGSDFMLSARKPGFLVRQRQERELRPLSESVAAAHVTVLNKIVHASKTDAGERPIRITAYAGEIDNIVTIPSAHSTFPERGVLPGDHSSIIVPESAEDVRYLCIKRHIMEALVTPVQAIRGFHGAVQAAPEFDYEVVSYKSMHLLPEGRRGKRVTRHVRVLRALVDGFSEYRNQQALFYPSGPRPEIKLLSPGSFAMENIRPESFNGLQGHRFDFVVTFPPMKKGQERTLEWIREVELTEADFDEPFDSVSVTPTVPVVNVEMSVRFPPDVQPARIWAFTSVRSGDRRRPELAERTLTIEEDTVTASWAETKLGRSTGIGWEW